MKKILILPILLFLASFCMAQCPQTSCNDSFAYNITKDTLVVSTGYTNIVWTIIAGPGILGVNTITNLKPSSTTVLLLTASSGNMTTVSIKTITIAPVPIVQRTAIGYSYNKTTGKSTFTYDDGTFSLKQNK